MLGPSVSCVDLFRVRGVSERLRALPRLLRGRGQPPTGSNKSRRTVPDTLRAAARYQLRVHGPVSRRGLIGTGPGCLGRCRMPVWGSQGPVDSAASISRCGEGANETGAGMGGVSALGALLLATSLCSARRLALRGSAATWSRGQAESTFPFLALVRPSLSAHLRDIEGGRERGRPGRGGRRWGALRTSF